jgi:hypothetical protein
VKVEWVSLSGADSYRVYRDGQAIGEDLKDPGTPTISMVDSSAPANSKLTYTVKASQKKTIQGLPGTPNAGHATTVSTLMQTSNPVTVSTPPAPQLAQTVAPALSGWVDLHTHPMSNLAFGGQLFWGGQDESAFQTIDTRCRGNQAATGIADALGPENSCNNLIRKGIVFAVQQMAGGVGGDNSTGFPNFTNWPVWQDGAHQKMWYEWIDRARKYGNLRVMVGLAHNNKALGEVAQSMGPTNDKDSGDLQLREMWNFVKRHPDIMDVALDSQQLFAIANSGRIAVLLGVELDQLGNMDWDKPGKTREQAVADEIQRLYDVMHVRYVFPIHLQDNLFGGTAIYDAIFNIANVLKNGIAVRSECAPCSDEIGYSLPQPPVCNQGSCRFKPGHRNVIGLTSLGEFAIKEMMKRGMIVDIDHMSEKAANRALDLAEAVPGYPLVSGHSGLRKGDVEHHSAENSRTTAQMARLLRLGGMFGQGTDGADGWGWARDYLEIARTMTTPGSVSIGTDMNSFVKSPKPTGRSVAYNKAFPPKPEGPLGADFPMPVSTTTAQVRQWDLKVDGVAQYGMMADFIRDISRGTTSNGAGYDGTALVNNQLMKSADYFFHMWQKCESLKGKVR